MRLTEDQINSIIAKLHEISPNGFKCPICGNNEWTLNELVIESREFHYGKLSIGGKSAIVPFVSITCKNCSHTLLFNAIKIGVVNKNQDNLDISNEDGK